MRFFWLAALCALAIIMALLTPYVFRHEPLWQAVGGPSCSRAPSV